MEWCHHQLPVRPVTLGIVLVHVLSSTAKVAFYIASIYDAARRSLPVHVQLSSSDVNASPSEALMLRLHRTAKFSMRLLMGRLGISSLGEVGQRQVGQLLEFTIADFIQPLQKTCPPPLLFFV
jgi:hypothetical protein